MRGLVVAEDDDTARILGVLLERESIDVEYASTIKAAQAALKTARFEIVVIDLAMPGDRSERGGFELVRLLRRRKLSVVPILLEADEASDDEFRALDLDIDHFVPREDCRHVLPGILREIARAARAGDMRAAPWIARSPASILFAERLDRAAKSCAPLLVQGPSGSGKTFAVSHLHASSAPSDAPRVAGDCDALADPAWFFGDLRAGGSGPGLLSTVGEGTLVLDDIAFFPLESQPRLARLLDERRWYPIGSVTELPFRGRVIGVTREDLVERSRAGAMRPELAERFLGCTLEVPVLCERREDIPDLVLHFLSEIRSEVRPTQAALRWLSDQTWRGEARMLQQAARFLAEEARTRTPDVTECASLLLPFVDRDGHSSTVRRIAREIAALPIEGRSKLDVVARATTIHALSLARGNATAAGNVLGVGRHTVTARVQDAIESAKSA